MKQNNFNYFIAGIGLLTAGFLSCNKEPQRPNILFIAVDDLRPELGCYGVDYAISPNIDKLASNGIVFTQAYCQSSVCNPSRVSLMLGMRPNKTGVTDLWTNFRNIIPGAVTLPQYLGQNGYHTVAIGKLFHNTFPDTLSWTEPKMYVKGFPFDPDATYCSEISLAVQEERKQKFIENGMAKHHIDQFGEWYIKAHATECANVPDNAYYDGAQTDMALEKLEELSKRNQPFFFGIGFYKPHLPFNAPKKYWDMYDPKDIPLTKDNSPPKNAPRMALNNLREIRGYVDFQEVAHPIDGQISDEEALHLKHGYLACVSYVDFQIGRLMHKLKQLNLLDNTIIILWGDNGFKLGEKGSWCKMTNYDIDTRVPLIVSKPGMQNKGLKSNRFVEFIDIFPSLCELTGIKVPDHLEGQSFVPLMTNPDQPWKDMVYSQFYREGIWTAPDSINYNGYSVRTKDYLYVEWYSESTNEMVGLELYDLKNDPDETVNVIHQTDHNLITELRKKLSLVY